MLINIREGKPPGDEEAIMKLLNLFPADDVLN